MPKPPMDPDSFDKVNFVIDAWTQGCSAPWYIYVETMKPALLTAFITLITFGMDDVLRGYFRPRGLYKRRWAKRKGKFYRRVPRFPELGNTLGKHLPGATAVRGITWTKVGKTLWRIDGAMEAIRFFWLVAAITEDFAFDWTSLLFESYWCQPNPPGRFSYTHSALGTSAGHTWKRRSYDTEDYEFGPPYWARSHGTAGPEGAVVTAVALFEKISSEPPPTETAIRVINMDTDQVLFQSGPDPAEPDGSSVGIAMGTVPPGVRFQVRTWHNTTYARVGKGVVIGRGVETN